MSEEKRRVRFIQLVVVDHPYPESKDFSKVIALGDDGKVYTYHRTNRVWEAYEGQPFHE